MYIAITFIKNYFYLLFFYNVKTVELVIRNYFVINTITIGPFTDVAIWNREIFVTRFENFISLSYHSST